MILNCEAPSVIYPMYADIYYPTIEQSPYGNTVKTWTLDRIVIGNFTHLGTKAKEELIPNVNITQDSIILGRVIKDIRISADGTQNALTNVLITNIRDRFETEIYTETSGPRRGFSTLFEVATQEPFISPFGTTEYYKLVLRRSENQGGMDEGIS